MLLGQPKETSVDNDKMIIKLRFDDNFKRNIYPENVEELTNLADMNGLQAKPLSVGWTWKRCNR